MRIATAVIASTATSAWIRVALCTTCTYVPGMKGRVNDMDKEAKTIDEINDAIRVLREVCEQYSETCNDCPFLVDDCCALEIEPKAWKGIEPPIDEAEIIERLEHLATQAVLSAGQLPYVLSLDDGIALQYAVERLKWIPCSERLPQPNQYVNKVMKYYLVQDEYGDMMVASYRQATLSDTSSGARYWEQMNSLHAIKDKIVAWMELPKPLKYWYERYDGSYERCDGIED